MRKRSAQLELELALLLIAPSTTRPPEQLEGEIAIALSEHDPEPTPPVNPYEVKQAAKRERLERAAARARGESAAAYGAARHRLDAIPFGQPILVGHHSEGRHRRDVAKADRAMRKSIEADKRSKELAARAAAVGTGGVSSDDPAAATKLRAQLAKLEKLQLQMKHANEAIRKHAKAGPSAQVGALTALGYSERSAKELLQKDFAGRIGFAGYQLTNNSANIRRIKQRIESLSARATAPERPAITGHVEGVAYTIVENRELNRVQIRFDADAEPSSAVRQRLRAAGFRWAPSERAWQRQLSNQAWYQAQRAVLTPVASSVPPRNL